MSISGASIQDLAAAAVAAVLRNLVDAGGSAGHGGLALSDNSIATDGALGKDNPVCRVNVLRDRDRWRVRLTDPVTGKRESHIFATEDEARREAPRLQRAFVRPVGVRVSEALEEYRQFLQAKGNRPRTMETTMGRLRNVLREGDTITGDVTPKTIGAWWAAFTTPGEGKAVPSIDTQAGVANQSRTFFRWLKKKGWVKVDDLMAGVEIVGKRRRGKPQFVGVDETKRFVGTVLELSRVGDTGATAALTCLLMGMRASEVADRVVRELDDEGRVLVITAAKTEAGVRRLLVPEVLRPELARLVEGLRPEEKIFGAGANRAWVRSATLRLCRVAGVSRVTPHGLRGTHASLAVEAGASGQVVAASLGHESFEGVTARHYATSESVSGARTSRVARALG